MHRSNLSLDSITSLSAPFEQDTILQVRIGKVKPWRALKIESAIAKTLCRGPVQVRKSGCEGDEQGDLVHHGGPDKALLHYCARHYDSWKRELPDSARLFNLGGFGENLVSATANEQNVCIGDIYNIGQHLRVQATLPRAPCFKLNHRFQVKDMAYQAQTKRRTGWFYRVLHPGPVQVGDAMTLVKRPNPQWSVATVQHYLYTDMKSAEMMREALHIEGLGQEALDIFQARLQKNFENQAGRLYGNASMALKTWKSYRIEEKRVETPRIASFILQALDPATESVRVEPGSHVRLRLGNYERAYSVVAGTHDRFEIGVALSESSRGGSTYLHNVAKVRDVIPTSDISTSFPLSSKAEHHILVAGGIGITAFVAAAVKLQEQNYSFDMHLAVRSQAEVPFKRFLDKLDPRLKIYAKSDGSQLKLDTILSNTKPGTHVYCCGPSRLMEGVTKSAKIHGIPEASVHFETFEAANGGDPFTAILGKSGDRVSVDAHKTLLEALRDVGLDVPSSCEAGSCGTCGIAVLKGRIEHRGTALSGSEKEGNMLCCVSRGVGEITLDL